MKLTLPLCPFVDEVTDEEKAEEQAEEQAHEGADEGDYDAEKKRVIDDSDVFTPSKPISNIDSKGSLSSVISTVE